MTPREKIFSYLLFVVLFLTFLWAIKSILFPFIAALAIAYFLNPLANKLVKIGVSRTIAASIILGGFLLLFGTLSFLILPLLYNQFLNLFDVLPNYINTILADLYPKIYDFTNKHGFVIEPDFHNYFNSNKFADIFDISGNFVGNIMQSSIALINVLSLIFITPILVFYMLKDWNLLVDKINKYLPAKHSKEIRQIFFEIDQTLSGYIHGQFNVCLILGIFYGLALSFLGLNFGFLIGFLTGFISFVPYVGLLCGIVAAIIVGLFQWGFNSFYIGWMATIFIFGQVAESNFLTPKLVGLKVGLHPVWMIFGLFVFSVLFGFVGLLLAMPITAICGVIIKSLALQYKKHFVG